MTTLNKKRFYIMYEESEDEYQVIDRNKNRIVKVFSTYESACLCADELEIDWMGG